MPEKKYTASDIKIVDPKKYKKYPVDISEQGFKENFGAAVFRAVEFAKTMVINSLPEKIKYILFMNSSNDIEALEEGEVKFYGDANKVVCYDSVEVFNYLWREGKVPEWIDISVCGVSDEYTELRLVCCGRFSSNKEQIYHAHEGLPPFHVLGPDLPQGFDLSSEGKFDLKENPGYR